MILRFHPDHQHSGVLRIFHLCTAKLNIIYRLRLLRHTRLCLLSDLVLLSLCLTLRLSRSSFSLYLTEILFVYRFLAVDLYLFGVNFRRESDPGV